MSRIEKLLEILDKREIDGFFIISAPSITYLTGFTGDSARLIVSRNCSILITDGRYTEQAARECYRDIRICKWIDDKRYAIDTYATLVTTCGIRKLAFEANIITYTEYELLKKGLLRSLLFPHTEIIETLRQIKDAEEIEHIRTACSITDKALEATIPFVKIGVSEIEIAAHLEFNLRMLGAEGLSFDTIVLSGANTSLLHGKPSERKLQKGDWLLFDYGALYKGYHADSSRTFIMGEASTEQKELYAIVKKAQAAAVASLLPDTIGKTPDDVVRKNIPEKYIASYYPGLGHGVGLEIHEQPFLSQTCNVMLKENMVITIEPGIYIPNSGGLRIEDTVLITKTGSETLTLFPKELQIL